ncbi:MAG: bifunctional [glutamate--ammonia ligase]-adenylyl-L-tyrosine phosphorylase/[glutamate--ammonia-ligase] adenylyltransferase [Xanthomonadales bacterium]|nr:bifunctional [glutamate--ammonia ligase]-adenylyl-L-tyrosine phosphorylase/[glutamate--ammonia-ligase] adenylyltransferase [Xanthomonadales bacterium]
MAASFNNHLERLAYQWKNYNGFTADSFPEAALIRLFKASPWAAEKLAKHPHWLNELWPQLKTQTPAQKDELEHLVSDTDLDTGLRVFRNRQMLQIIWRDCIEESGLEETLLNLSVLAEICVQFALDNIQQQLLIQHGQPVNEQSDQAHFVVLAMGKLGGRELNFSSDIDLIFFHTGHGKTAGNNLGQGRISNEQFFNRLAQRLIKCLSSIQAEGFVFRVDTRLRPHGQSGLLVPSSGALEQYYQTEGRDWERYALIKARPVAGNIASGNDLLEQLRPFIYRRYLDYGAIESLREMHQMIGLDAVKIGQKSTLGIDLKRGPGGIREAEFFVQSFQLLRGGRNPDLRQPGFLATLAALVGLKLLETKSADLLLSAYKYLRQLENRLQALHDQQIHHLPSNPEDQYALTTSMRFSDWSKLIHELQLHQLHVQQLFDGLFSSESVGNSQAQRYQALIQTDWQEAGICLESGELQALADRLQQLELLPLSARARARSQRLLGRVLTINLESPLSAPVWKDLLSFIIAVSRRSAYLALLIEHPYALDRLLHLFTSSSWLAAEIIRYPVLLDDLIDPKVNQPASVKDMQASLQRLAENSEDSETLLENFNQYKRGQQLRIAIAELSGELGSQQAQHFLSQLADCILQACLQAVIGILEPRHGVVEGLVWTVIAYGSLGAREMSYISDLDLVFLYQLNGNTTAADPRARLSDGSKALGAEQYAIRMGQRLIALLTTLTPAGRLYSVDSRLRPNGKSGTLVSSINAFARYQDQEAWIWEHQALSRARAICGDQALRAKFNKIRTHTLSKARQASKLKFEVVNMRQKMYAQTDINSCYQQLKQLPGGLGDIEFIAQHGILANAAEYQQLLLPTDTCGQLQALGRCALIESETMSQLVTAWQQLSRSRQQLTLQRLSSKTLGAQDIAAMAAVKNLWQSLMEE